MAIECQDDVGYAVVVVGAGAAGLQAVNVLVGHPAYQKGRMKVVLLEARDRVGGRICVDRRWGVPFDLGPNWIHGTLFNPLVPLAKSTETVLTFPDEACQTIFTSCGRILASDLSQRLHERVWEYADKAIEYSTKSSVEIPSGSSVFDFCVEQINAESDLDDEDKRIAKELVEWLTTFTAVDVRKQSLRYYQVEATFPGESPFVASTYENILGCLALPSISNGILRLCTPVSQITIQSDHIEVFSKESIFQANAVILTAPLGCLQRKGISFDPCLPPRIQSAIKNLGFGDLEKLFLRFETPWWQDSQKDNMPPEMYTFLPPVTLPPEAPKRLLTMFSLLDLPIHRQPVLVVYLADSWTTYLASLSDSDIKGLFEIHYLPKLPNYSQTHAIIDVVRTAWSADPWAYGSYTHVPIGSENGYEDLKLLGERILGLEKGDGGLWFAGEHAGTGDVGTVNGAMMSGSSAAFQVLKAFGENIDDLQ